MGDDDVICLSSDDESFVQSSLKRCKIVKIPVKNESQSHPPLDKSLKRKAQPQISNETNASEVKRSKCSANGAVEEVIILSPQKSEISESNCRPMPEKTAAATLKPKLSMYVEKVNISEKILRKNAEIKDSSKKELPRSDLRLSSTRDKILLSRHRENLPSASKEKPTSVSSEFRPENASVPSSEAKKSNFPVAKVSTTLGSKESIESNSSNKSTDERREKFEKSFSKNNDFHRARSDSLKPGKHEKIGEKSISLAERKSTNHADDKTKRSSLVRNLWSVPDGNSSNVPGHKTTRPNGDDGTTDSASKSQMDTSVSKTLQKTTNPRLERAEIVEKAKSSDSPSVNGSKKSLEVEIVETIEVPISDRLKDTTRESKNPDASTKESVGGSSSTQKASEVASPKSRSRTSSTEIVSSDISKHHESSKIAKTSIEKNSSPPNNVSPQSQDVRSIGRTTASPEIEIVEETKSSRTAERTISAVGESAGSSSSDQSSPESARASGRTGKIAATQNSISAETKSENGQKEERNPGKSCNKVLSSSEAGISNSSPKIGNGIDKIDENPTQTTHRAKSIKLSLIKSSDSVKNKIAPKRVQTSVELDEPNSGDSSSEVSNVENGKVAKSPGSKDASKHREPFEPVAGCSKTPDAVFVARKFSEKRKSSPDASFMTTLWKEEDERTERSESPDERETPRKPQLIVKTIKPVVSVKHDTFAMFLSLCLQTKRGDGMEKIVGKLKRYYEQLDPAYARSQEFSDLLNSRREKIISKGKIYYYIGQVFDEMKSRRSRRGTGKSEASSEIGNEGEGAEGQNEPDTHEERRHREKIRTITNAMKKCSKMIQQLEVAEVDFDEDNDSEYIKLERYKRKMIELYTKLCEYTNEHADAGRAYLRPKHLRVTQIPSIDQAINSFINSKISRSLKKAATGQSFVDGLIFPDYVDILECVDKVNAEQKLGLDKRRQEKLAREAFTQLGRHLQQARQRDYWDTFSLQLEDSEDPAATDPALAEKLLQNQEIAEKNTREIFEEYVRKQEEGTGANDEGSSSEDGKDEDENDDDDDEDNEKTSNNDAPSEFQLSEDENDESTDKNEDKDNPPEVLEPIPDVEAESDAACEDIDNRPPTVELDDTTNENNNVLETGKEKNVQQDVSSNGTKEIPAGIEQNENEAADRTNAEHGTERTERLRVPKSAEDPQSDAQKTRKAGSSNEILTPQPESTVRDVHPSTVSSKITKTISESPGPREVIREDMEGEVPEVRIEDETNENNNVLKVIETKITKQVSPSNGSRGASIDRETMEIEVKCAEKEEPIEPAIDETKDNEVNHAEPDGEAGIDPAADQPGALRIRSFAKPPSSWASSQEMAFRTMDVSPKTKAASNSETIDLLDDEPNNSACTTSITEVSVSPRIVRVTRSIPPNSKEAAGTRMPKILPKIAPTPKQRALNGCPSIVIGPQNRSTFNQLPNFTKIVPNQDLTKKITLLPGVTVRPATNSVPQSSIRPANLQNSSIGTIRTLNVSQNVRIAANTQNQMNVRLRPVDIPQNVQLRVGKNVRPVAADQVQVLRLANTNDLARSNDIQASPVPNNQILRVPVAQSIQPRPPNPGQQVRFRVAGNAQVARPTQPQILRLSNGQLMRASTATIRPLGAPPAQIQGITLKNPRFIRLQTSNNAAVPAAVTRLLPDNGQLRIERVENAAQQHCRRSANVDDSRIAQRTNPVLKPNTSNNTPSNNQHRKRGGRPEHENSCSISNGQPPTKK